jgi:DNA-binding beta-propeller fold protein YncE
MTYSDWRQYQEATASVFQRLGCNAQTDFRAAGAKGSHDVDVYATFLRSGILCTWIVECKLWTSRVPKEKVMALKAIVEDLGADRGIIVSEAGFQSGAQEATRGSNITLVTSLDEFAKTALAASNEIPLVLNTSENSAPIYKFPGQAAPHDLIVYRDSIITANWVGCSISIVNPASKTIVRTIDLDKYEATSPQTGEREIRGHPPGSLAIADGRLFVGQVFSDAILVIDLATQAIVKRIAVPGGGEGQLAASADEKTVYFASNRLSQFYVIDSATYTSTTVAYPANGRGCMSILPHPDGRLLYLGISRGGAINGKSYPHANSYLAIYDLAQNHYIADCQLAEIINGKTDDATPICITYDGSANHLYVGMFQSMRGICVIDTTSNTVKGDLRFQRGRWNTGFQWADPISQTIADGLLLSVNRNNLELAVLDRHSLQVQRAIYLGQSPNGPRAVVAWRRQAVVSYPGRNGLIFLSLDELTQKLP